MRGSDSFWRMPLRKGSLSRCRAAFITENITPVISVQSRWKAFFPQRFGSHTAGLSRFIFASAEWLGNEIYIN